MNKSLRTNILLFFLIKITFLTLFYVNIIEFVYGHDLIFLHDLDITDGYKIEFIQFSENLQNPQSQSGSQQQAQPPSQQQERQQLSPSGNLQSQPSLSPLLPQQQERQQQSPSDNLRVPQQPPLSDSESISPLPDELQRLLLDIPSQFPDDLLRADPSLLEKEISSSSEEGAVSLNATEMTSENTYTINVGKKKFIIAGGSLGDDRIIGTPGIDVIIGLPGSDNIRGGNDTDVIQGDEDADRLYGEKGNDIIQGGLGSDQVYGGDNDDILTGGVDDDLVLGENGNDKMYGDVGDDVLAGGNGADYFDCGDGIDVLIDFNLEEGDDRAGNCEELFKSK